jgi:hypothetical protein
VQYNFQVYEVEPNGTQKLINRVNYTDRNYSANSRRIKNVEGQAHAHTFKPGNRVRIIITNLDTSPDDIPFFGTNPFVLPALNNGYNYVYLNSNSYIELPIINSSADIFAELNVNTKSPGKFSLMQNYPNPFNPVTSISYSIAVKGFVTIKIYDILGREVNTIVNELRDAGTYEVMLDASRFASGVYFYTINSGSFTDTKKMLLVK